MKILFLVQNGIGMGHIRRCIAVANALRRRWPKAAIHFVSQAGSTIAFNDSGFKVLNIPFLHRLPNNQTEHALTRIVREYTRCLMPDVVVEDTHPDLKYREIPALQGVPRLLIIRRLCSEGYQNLEATGDIAHFDQILVMQEKAEFAQGSQSAEVKLRFLLSRRFSFIDPICAKRNSGIEERLRSRYCTGKSKLVVSSVGAGGEQLNERFCERLTKAVAQTAHRLDREGKAVHTVIVLGPYYRGPIPLASSSLTVLTHEPNLSALLAAADVVIVRPSYNSVHEALSGNPALVLVPGQSFFEMQYEWCMWLRRKYGAEVVPIDDLGKLYQVVSNTLGATTKRRSEAFCGADQAARFIMQLAARPAKLRTKGRIGFIFVIENSKEKLHVKRKLCGLFPGSIVLCQKRSLVSSQVKLKENAHANVILALGPMKHLKIEVANANCVLYAKEGPFALSDQLFEEFLGAVLPVPLTYVQFELMGIKGLLQVIQRCLSVKPSNLVLLDLSTSNAALTVHALKEAIPEFTVNTVDEIVSLQIEEALRLQAKRRTIQRSIL